MREFPPFRLDTGNQCLWRGDGLAEERILLAPKTFAVLRYLVEHPGRLVTHDELFEALWPKTYVQPEVLKSHIAAIRTGLGDDARKPLFIETLSRRGYRFIAPVREGASARASRTTNLPEAVSELIGREAELGAVTALATEHRLVSLVGAGGIGKTRLGLEGARHLLPRYPDGVFVAELGPLSSPELVPTTVASALGLTHVAGTASPERIAGAIRAKRLLLVIDNCEHVIDAAAGMAETLLRAGPSVSLLATSREPLRVSGEYIYRVPTLGFQMRGIINELYLDDLREKTLRGQKGQKARGFTVGEATYGYRSVPVGEMRVDRRGRPRPDGYRMVIDSAEAQVVLRIFHDFSEGKAVKALTKELNVEEVQGRRKFRRGWSPSTISRMLKNEKYIGRWIWNRSETRRDPKTGRKRKFPKPENEW